MSTDKPKKGLLERLIGSKNSGCCNLQIEELPDNANEAIEQNSSTVEKGSSGCC